jgi:hypothetical protein
MPRALHIYNGAYKYYNWGVPTSFAIAFKNPEDGILKFTF